MTLRVLTPYRVSDPFHSPHTELALDDAFSVWQIVKSIERFTMQGRSALLVSVILRMMATDASVYADMPALST